MSRGFAAVVALATLAACGSAVSDPMTSRRTDALRVEPFDRLGCASGPVRAVVSRPGYFEGVTASPQGDLYTSDQTTLNVFRFTPAGDGQVIAKLYDPPTDDSMYAGTFGMAFSADGALWIVVYDYWEDSRHHGVWRVDRDGSAALAYPMPVDQAPFPNALAFDDRGNLYVTESATGTIWRAARGGRAARPWLQHSTLEGLPTGFRIGANGIVFKNGALYVANTDQGTVVRVPVDARGEPGTPTIFARNLETADGLALGPWNDLYVALAFSGRLARLADDGTSSIVAETGLPLLTSVVFGAGSEHTTAYAVNVAAGWDVPMLVKVDVCAR